jgi:hypothetical protein
MISNFCLKVCVTHQITKVLYHISCPYNLLQSVLTNIYACSYPGLEDISPYATFQINDPKFHKETFSQEIVVGKFHPVNHGLPRASRDKWMSDRDCRQMQDSEDSENENSQRYSIIPVQRARLGNLYQINPPSQPPPPLPYQQMVGYQQQQQQQQQHLHHHQQIHPDNSDFEEDDDNSSSEENPSRTTMDRRIAKKDR